MTVRTERSAQTAPFGRPHPSDVDDAAALAASLSASIPGPDAMVTAIGRDGELAVSVSGDPEGVPVFLLHGTPGSRIGPKPRPIVLHDLGVRLFSYDRPGYGFSDRDPDRRVAGAADDVEAIARHYDLDRFAVVGRSGGGPHALACAALLPKRVTRVAVLVGLAPANAADDAKDFDWFQGMGEGNVREYGVADTDERRLVARLNESALRTQQDPDSFLRALELESLTDSDLRVLHDIALRRELTRSYVEAFRQGAGGWIDDVLAFRRGWKFDPKAITAPTKLWHGRDDRFSPYGHTQWLSSKIRDVEFEVERGLGHFAAVEVLPWILSWLLHGNSRAARPFASPPEPSLGIRRDRWGRSDDRPAARPAAL